MPKYAFIFIPLLVFSLSAFAGTVETISIPSKKMGKAFSCTVILPEKYNGRRKFKQIYLLHGAGGNHDAWHKTVRDLRPYADKLKRIIVCTSEGSLSWYNKNNKSEDYIIKEVIPAIDGKYKTKNDRWISGFSMGGFGALSLGFKYPKLFSAFGGQSPCIKPSTWTHKWGIAKSMGAKAKEGKHDLFGKKMIKKLKKDRRPFSILCGEQDFFFKENLEAYQSLKKSGVKVHWIKKMQGAHNGKYWAESVDKQLKYFAKKSK
mgnify:CR=1 FL=1